MHTELIPIKTDVKKNVFDLFETIVQSIKQSGDQICDNDIIVISSKFVAVSQGSVVKLSSVIPSESAVRMAEKFTMDPRVVEIVLQESDSILNGIEGFILAVKDGVIAPNAGIDRSNVQQGYVILHPRDPFNIARTLRRKFFVNLGKHVGIVLSDSRLMPMRIGTIGIAVAVAGFEPTQDLRGKEDLFGNILRVTLKATADSIATSANMIMGESSESIPLVIVRNCNVKMSDNSYCWKDLAISNEQCIYIRGLRWSEN